MAYDIDPETINADHLPGIWSPVQWELNDDEQIIELEQQATANLLWVVDIPEALLRLLLNETVIEPAYKPPRGYDPKVQGEWDDDLATFKFKRNIELVTSERSRDHLYLEYKIEDIGSWAVEIEPDKASIYRL